MPPIGGLTIFAFGGLGQIASGQAPEGRFFWFTLLLGWVPYVMFSYLAGGLQSLLTGVVSAIYHRRNQRLPVSVPVLAAAVSAVPALAVVVLSTPEETIGKRLYFICGFLACHLVPAFLVGKIADRRLLKSDHGPIAS